ncbi:hypothetical protein DZA50_02315 [Kangiella sp. HD9-110m-PIT-SAG07]|nr:hypothetical protein DZA50_02315 [Kangiella sp. HD9-110m-PIT-SAG07]
MKTQVVGLAASVIILQACASSPSYYPPKKPIYKGVYPLLKASDGALDSDSPLITINGINFILPESCSMARQFGNSQESRQFGDVADSRQFGDAQDSRQFGDDADSRQFGDAQDSRQFGDDADSRQFGDAQDSRQFGDDADSRQFGDDADSRQFGDAQDSRLFGGDVDSRQFGDAQDSRQFGDIADSRQFGDGQDSRQFGNQSNEYKCVKVPAINSVVVTGLVGHEVVAVRTGDDFLNYQHANDSIILKY